MEGSIVFYTYGSSVELNGTQFVAGELTADLLNLSAGEFRSLRQQYQEIKALSKECERGHNRAVWWELNNELEDLCCALRKYRVFQILLTEDDILFSETRSYTGRYSLFPEDDDQGITENDLAAVSRLYESEDAEDFLNSDNDCGAGTGADHQRERKEPFDSHYRDVPDAFLIWPGEQRQKWRYYERAVSRYGRYLSDISAFNPTIHNFIRFLLSNLDTNSPENYAAALYEFYNDPRLAEKLIIGPTSNGDTYTCQDVCTLSYVPRKKPGGGFSISQEHVTDRLQGLLKADYMQALINGHNIRQS